MTLTPRAFKHYGEHTEPLVCITDKILRLRGIPQDEWHTVRAVHFLVHHRWWDWQRIQHSLIIDRKPYRNFEKFVRMSASLTHQCHPIEYGNYPTRRSVRAGSTARFAR